MGVRTRARGRKASSVFYSIHRPYTEFFSITLVATKYQLIMALALLTLSLNLLPSVDVLCLNCESPHGEWCCNTSWNGICCEYPVGCCDDDKGNAEAPAISKESSCNVSCGKKS